MKCPNLVTRYLVLDANGKWTTVSKVPGDTSPYRVVKHPCGHCHACRVNHSKKWAARCVHEAQCHSQNIFLNLTVNDDSLIKLFHSVPITDRQRLAVIRHRKRFSYQPQGSFSYDVLKGGRVYSLSHRPIQLFIKRLRRALGGTKIKYFCAGEYGPSNLRPHWHIIIFGYRPSDLIPFNRRGKNVVYTSPFIDRLWSDPVTGDPYGYSLIGNVTPASAQYVAQYSLKKLKGSDNRENYYGESEPEYLRASQGIGKEWINKYWREVYSNSGIVLDGKPFCGIPRYYDKFMRKEHPEEHTAYSLASARESLKELDFGEQVLVSPREQAIAHCKKYFETFGEDTIEKFTSWFEPEYHSTGRLSGGVARYIALTFAREVEALRALRVAIVNFEKIERCNI